MTPAKYAHGIINGIYMMPDELEAACQFVSAVPENGLMVEWGSGGSTCKWLEILKEPQRLISIESNLDWANRVQQAVDLHFGPRSFEMLYRPELFPVGRVSGEITEEIPYGADHYVNADERIFDADLFLIDGIARAACMAAVAIKRRKKNAVVLWHDYTYRVGGYNWITQFFEVEILAGTLARIKI
jgi:hypothetical protein